MSVLCCKCGIAMFPNPTNICGPCLSLEADITQGLLKHTTVIRCPECCKYLQPPKTWVHAPPDSPDLKALCIKRLNLDKARAKLVCAEFIVTESHSKMIKIKLTIEREVLNGAKVWATYTVEYVVQDHNCDLCARLLANPDQWVANVQLIQHVSHRRTFFYLEQYILKHDLASKAIKIQQKSKGLDFFFAKRSHASTFAQLVCRAVPIKTRDDRKLVSHDSKSNNCNDELIFLLEISPICREDLICLPPELSRRLGKLGPLVICTKVTSQIVLLDPWSLRCSSLSADQYWQSKFESLLSSRSLVEYIVLYVYDVSVEVNVNGSRYAMASADVARVADFGRNDNIFTVRTHLGNVLRSGDYAFGYDLDGANFNNAELDKYRDLELPRAILIKKSYERNGEKKCRKNRPWKLRSLKMEVENMDEEKVRDEYEQFLRDLEENPELRFNVSLYRDKEYMPSDTESMTDGEGPPSVPLEELLADLDLNKKDEDEFMEEC